MYHQGNLFSNFDNWWEIKEEVYEGYTINKLDFEKFIFKKGFNKGDILFVIKANPEKLKVGDVIIFDSNYQNPIIHRIVEIKDENGEKIFFTLGDNNPQQLSFDKNIIQDQLVGKAVLKIAPYIGWGKLLFFEGGKSPSERGLCD